MPNPQIACPYCHIITQSYIKDNVVKVVAHDRPDGIGCPMGMQPLLYGKKVFDA